MISQKVRSQGPELKVLTSQLAGQVTRSAVILLLSATVYAQSSGMPGGGMPGIGMPGTPGMGAASTVGYGSSGSPGYGHGAAIGIGVGAAAAGTAAAYLLTHRTSKVTGCVQAADDGLRLTDAKTQKTLSLDTETADAKSGERVELKGKIKKSAAGNQNFFVKSVTKDFGQCRPDAAS